ncbi:MAG: hypothetical protein RL662_430 [Bacteroidota bacterium]|jgi:hypothetical protein
MKKIRYISVLLFCIISILQVNSQGVTEKRIHVTELANKKPGYIITTTHQTIHIHRLENNAQVMIFDMNGRAVVKQKANHRNMTVSVRSGDTYIIRIENGQETTTQKVFVP